MSHEHRTSASKRVWDGRINDAGIPAAGSVTNVDVPAADDEFWACLKEVNGNRLRWWNRLAVRWGLRPFRRCPNGVHVTRNIYGDEIIFASNGFRSRCLYCTVFFPGLNGKGKPQVGTRRRRWSHGHD